MQEVKDTLDNSSKTLSEESEEINTATEVLEETTKGFTTITRVINSVVSAQKKLKDLEI
ncbi:hypothetical protein [Thermotoga sp.]|uniref:hypothetical protein n=1 Tax=Thermotoga sp. TaxID=28240 RepID=UPI0025E2CBAE|nr:hypothetical protein [Thermotoga sp.]